MHVVIFLAIPEMTTCKEKLASCWSASAACTIYGTCMVLLHLLSSPSLRRSRAPRVGQHQCDAFVAGVRRGLGDGAQFQLVVRAACHHKRRGHCLQGRHYALRDQDALLRPLHVHGQQQAGPKHGHLHGRLVGVMKENSMGKCRNVCSSSLLLFWPWNVEKHLKFVRPTMSSKGWLTSLAFEYIHVLFFWLFCCCRSSLNCLDSRIHFTLVYSL